MPKLSKPCARKSLAGAARRLRSISTVSVQCYCSSLDFRLNSAAVYLCCRAASEFAPMHLSNCSAANASRDQSLRNWDSTTPGRSRANCLTVDRCPEQLAPDERGWNYTL